MSFLRALRRLRQLGWHTPEPASGLPSRNTGDTAGAPASGTPDEAVLLDAPDARLSPALVAAAAADHAPVAALLAATREAAEWENRDRYVSRLAAFAQCRDDWLAGWLAAAPRDPDALLVKAELAVRRAWDSPARAERLREIAPLIDAAAEAVPLDPVPWRIALDHARGTHATHTAFETLWEQAVRRAPHHYGCHVAALKYLSAQWYGSHRECFDFAEQAAHDALPGSLIQALPVRAAFAQYLAGDGPVGSVQQERIDEAADLAIALSAEYAAGDPWPAEVRNVLVQVLLRRERWADALEQFERIGPCATSFPWTSVTDDPLAAFLEARTAVRLRVASAMALRGRAARHRPSGHYA
ncbi:hypothetical protein [Streptomyces sp. NPDC050504]|uniref:hypothetical protein n=1 Tax=Streptomyces sp. NPDC050504 TaxID=3365618 RepID=UPI00378AF204